MKMKKKTRTTRVYNPDLNEYEWREVETGKYVFDETDKIAIVREYHERGCPASEIVAKYHISSSVVLYGWLDKYLNEKVCVSLPLEALRMALATLPEGDAPYLTHHSYRGCQYCSRTYVDTLKSRKIQISMTQSGLQKRCWKNPWERPPDTKIMSIFAPPKENSLGFVHWQ